MRLPLVGIALIFQNVPRHGKTFQEGGLDRSDCCALILLGSADIHKNGNTHCFLVWLICGISFGIRLSGPALVRPKKDPSADKKVEHCDAVDRIEGERVFSLAKNLDSDSSP